MKARIPNQGPTGGNMMKKLQEMQANMEAVQAELAVAEYSASAGGGALQEALSLIFLLAFVFFLVLYTVPDFEQQVIFDNMLLPFPLLGGIYTTLMGMPIFDHALAAATGGIVFLLISILTHGGIGGGDIKLIASLGLWLGTDALLSITITGLILGGIAALLLLITGKKKRNEYFAYGPYFTIVTILLTVY